MKISYASKETRLQSPSASWRNWIRWAPLSQFPPNTTLGLPENATPTLIGIGLIGPETKPSIPFDAKKHRPQSSTKSDYVAFAMNPQGRFPLHMALAYKENAT